MKTCKFILALSFASINFLQAQTLKDAIKLSDNEQFESAGKAFETLVQQQPTNGDNYFYFGENYFNAENTAAALKMYTKGIEVMPNNPLNYIGIGKLQSFEGKSAEAKVNLDKALALGAGKNILVLLKVAETYTQAPQKNLLQAMQLLDAAMKLDPKNTEIYLLKGDVYQEMGEGSKAIELYKKTAEMDKSSVKALLRIGKLYGRAKNYPLAFDFYSQAAKIDSTFAPAYREQGELLYLSKQYDKAKLKYKRYLDLCGSNNLSARMRYGSFLYLSKEYPAAIAEITEVQKLDTSINIMNRILAYSYYEKGDYLNGTISINKFFSRAANEGTKVLASDFEYSGKLLSKTGKDSLAIIEFYKAMQFDTTKTELYGEIGAIYLKQKKNKEAINAYEKKIAAKKFVTANDYYNIGKAAYFMKDYAKADTSFGMVISLQPKITNGYIWRAKTQTQLDLESTKGLAKPWYEKFLEMGPDPVKNKVDIIEANAYLGYYYFVKKDNVNSKTYWLKVKEIDPNNEKAKKALEAIK